jgi:PAS domain S-box-containing protein
MDGEGRREGRFAGPPRPDCDLKKLPSWDILWGGLARHSGDLLCVMDFDGRVDCLSRAWERALGWAPEELLSRRLTDLIHPDDTDRTLTMVREVAQGRTVSGFENRFRARDGSYRTLAWSAFPLPDERLFVAVGREATPHRTSSEHLRRTERMDGLARLASGIAHDFRNLLAVIMAHAQVAKLHISRQDGLGHRLEEINEAAAKAGRLADRLSWFGQPKKPRMEAVDLNDLVMNLAELLRLILRDSVELDLQLDSEIGSVRGDKSQIEEVVVNLCINARDAMPNGGRVVISTGAAGTSDRDWDTGFGPGDYVILEISDTGVGIPPQLRERIFEPFFTTKTSGGGGTGLGLPTSYTIVNSMGGDIQVTSIVDEGSQFRVILPSEERTVIADVNPPADSARSPEGRKTVLIVDDERSVRTMTAKMIAQLGYQALEAGHSSDALQLSEIEDGIDLLLADVVMPGLSGPELAEALRKHRPELKVLYMSGYVHEDLGGAMTLPSDAILLEKPFDRSQLALKLREALERTCP